MRIAPKVITLFLCVLVVCITLFLMCKGTSNFLNSRGVYPAMIKMENELKQDGINFTSVILATDLESLERTLEFHCSLPCIQKVVVVWNNLESLWDDDKFSTRFSNGCRSSEGAAIITHVLQQRDNSINNQFKPFTEIDTDVVFIAQVDVIMSIHDVLLGLEAWTQYPHLIVGYRPWKIDVTTADQLHYRTRAPTDSYNIILSDALLMHKKYLHTYTKNTPTLLYNEIHSHFNGDKFSRDVLLNIAVAQFLKNERMPQSPCLWIKARKWKSKGLVSNGDSQVWTLRNKFLDKIQQVYGYNLSLYDSNRILSHEKDLIL